MERNANAEGSSSTANLILLSSSQKLFCAGLLFRHTLPRLESYSKSALALCADNQQKQFMNTLVGRVTDWRP